MLNDAFDRAVLSTRIPAFEYGQQPVTMLDDMPLNLDQLDLKRSKRGFIFRTSTRISSSFRHWLWLSADDPYSYGASLPVGCRRLLSARGHHSRHVVDL